jgi:hypothetical protein
MSPNDIDSEALKIIDDINRGPVETDATLSEALKRIEEANLFYTLIKTNVFSQDSARPDILESVNNKVRQFAKRELSKLLGMSKDESLDLSDSNFSKDQIKALRTIADTMLKKNPNHASQEVRKPTVNQVSTSPVVSTGAPSINQVQVAPAVNTAQEDQVLSKTFDSQPTKEEKEAARNAILAKARKIAAEKRGQAKAAKGGGAAGYALPPNYTPPPQQPAIVQPPNTIAAGGLNVNKLVQELGVNQQVVTVLPDTDIGGDPNARL